MLIAERMRPLRIRSHPTLKRFTSNVLLALLGLMASRLISAPLTEWAGSTQGQWSFGIKAIVGFIALDATLWIWHLLNHKVPFLWRFHQVHHSDLNMDASTALRFHFGELALSGLFRTAQVLILGVSPALVIFFEVSVTASAMFHHSNFRIPLAFERYLVWFIVTPRMHGVHHSVVQNETDSNYSAIFPIWDKLAGTLKLNIPQAEVHIGVPYLDNFQETQFPAILWLPFRKLKPRLFPNGTTPSRTLISQEVFPN